MFGKYSIEGKTVNQVLSEQKKFDDDKAAPLLGSWTCNPIFSGEAYPSDRVIFIFNPNHTETVLFTAPKTSPRRELYRFSFNGSGLDEENPKGLSYFDSVSLSGGILRIERGTEKSQYNEWTNLMWPDMFTCRRG